MNLGDDYLKGWADGKKEITELYEKRVLELKEFIKEWRVPIQNPETGKEYWYINSELMLDFIKKHFGPKLCSSQVMNKVAAEIDTAESDSPHECKVCDGQGCEYCKDTSKDSIKYTSDDKLDSIKDTSKEKNDRRV